MDNQEPNTTAEAFIGRMVAMSENPDREVFNNVLAGLHDLDPNENRKVMGSPKVQLAYRIHRIIY